MPTEATAEPNQADAVADVADNENKTSDENLLDIEGKDNADQESLLNIDEKSQNETEQPSKEGETQGDVPIEYDISLPEDSLLDDSAKDSVLEFAKENKLPNEIAQGILEREAQAVQNFEATRLDEWDQQADGWKKELASDAEIGNDNWKETQVVFTQAMKKFAPEGFAKELEETQMLYHPKFVRMMRDIGMSMQSGTFVIGEGKPDESNRNGLEGRADRMFGNLEKKD